MSRPTFLILSICMLLGAVSLATAPAAHAQPADAARKMPSQKDIAAARKHFQAAEAAKARGEYQLAAVEYLAAYELFAEPAFFFDTAEVYRLAGEDKQALTYYEKYLELDPKGQGAASSRIAVDQLRRSIAAREDAARREAEAEEEATARREAEDKARRAAAATAPAAASRPGGTAPAPRKDPGRGLRVAGLTVGSIGVLSTGIGALFGLRARKLSNEAADWERFDRRRYDEGESAETTMFVLTGIGAAAIITGGVLYYLGRRATTDDDSRRITVVPIVGETGLAIGAIGQF